MRVWLVHSSRRSNHDNIDVHCNSSQTHDRTLHQVYEAYFVQQQQKLYCFVARTPYISLEHVPLFRLATPPGISNSIPNLVPGMIRGACRTPRRKKSQQKLTFYYCRYHMEFFLFLHHLLFLRRRWVFSRGSGCGEGRRAVSKTGANRKISISKESWFKILVPITERLLTTIAIISFRDEQPAKTE